MKPKHKLMRYYSRQLLLNREGVADLDEKRALKALKQGDSEAFEWIIDHYTGYINTIIYNIIGHVMAVSDIEEVASDVFLALWKNSDKVVEKKLKAYLGSIARNKAKDKLRELNMSVHIEHIEDDIIFVSDTSPENVFIEKERQHVVKTAILSMKHPDREIFLRHYYYYQSVLEISKEMEINISTVKTKLVRGREILKNFLSEGGYFDGN
jgi:RNA polymerase sigma-70 factor (ECF subfamily)